MACHIKSCNQKAEKGVLVGGQYSLLVIFFFFFCLFPTRDMVPPTCKADPLSQLNSGDTLTDIPKVCLLDDPKRN